MALCLLFASACSCPGPTPDGGIPDAGEDAGTVDGGRPDAGQPDAGPRDAGTLPDAGALRCLGVACVGDTTCSLEDGECRCNGTTCQPGQTCTCPAGMPGCQPGERVCETSSRCDSVTCTGGAQCDAADGLCKCGGSSGPVCSDAQFCGAIRPPQCQGGGCAQLCDDGTSCDADDGTCKCGGRGGSACSSGEVCVSSATQYVCRLRCAPLAGPCPEGQACFVDTRPAAGVSYCAFPSALLGEGEACSGPTQCFDAHALHCAGLTAQVPSGTCREACDPSQPRCAAGRHCVALSDVRDAGFCVP